MVGTWIDGGTIAVASPVDSVGAEYAMGFDDGQSARDSEHAESMLWTANQHGEDEYWKGFADGIVS